MADSQTPLGERLETAIDTSTYNQSSLARELGTSSQVVNKWVNQGVIPEGRFLVRLPALLGVSGDWLLSDKGPMHPSDPDVEAQAFRDVAEIVRVVTEASDAYPRPSGGSKGNGDDSE